LDVLSAEVGGAYDAADMVRRVPPCAGGLRVAPMPGVSDVYFTNAQSGPGYQLYNAGSPYQILPPVGAFDRERDTRITIVIIFSTGSAHALRAVLNAPSGGTPRPVSWAAP